MQTDGRMLRACAYTQTRVHTEGPQGTHCGALSTATVTTATTASLGLEAARCSWEVLRQHGDRSGILPIAPASRLSSPRRGSRAGAGSSRSLRCRQCGSELSRAPAPLPPGSLHAALGRQSPSFPLLNMLPLLPIPPTWQGSLGSCAAPSESGGGLADLGEAAEGGQGNGHLLAGAMQKAPCQSPHAFA